jgi:hypothetical protein
LKELPKTTLNGQNRSWRIGLSQVKAIGASSFDQSICPSRMGYGKREAAQPCSVSSGGCSSSRWAAAPQQLLTVLCGVRYWSVPESQVELFKEPFARDIQPSLHDNGSRIP